MKILQVVICLCLLGAITHTEPLDSLVSFRRAVLQDQGLPYGGATVTSMATVDSAINRAAFAISTFYPAIPKLDTVWGIEDSSIYPFNDDFISLGWIMTKDYDTVQFRIVGGYFVRFGTPDDIDTMLIAYFATATEMGATDTTTIDRKYRERVVDYANYLIAKVRGQHQAAALFLQASGLKP